MPFIVTRSSSNRNLRFDGRWRRNANRVTDGVARHQETSLRRQHLIVSCPSVGCCRGELVVELGAALTKNEVAMDSCLRSRRRQVERSVSVPFLATANYDEDNNDKKDDESGGSSRDCYDVCPRRRRFLCRTHQKQLKSSCSVVGLPITFVP